jgi:hypothetical protein
VSADPWPEPDEVLDDTPDGDVIEDWEAYACGYSHRDGDGHWVRPAPEQPPTPVTLAERLHDRAEQQPFNPRGERRRRRLHRLARVLEWLS